MKSMIWKELRENALWGALMLLASVSATIWFMSEEFVHRLNLRIFVEELPIFLTTIGVICALVMGCLQMIPELWRDRWAFLIHRGVSTGTIFRAKTFSALIIYLLVVGLPLVIAVTWAVATGFEHYPFEWRMVLPSVVAIVAAFGAYFVVYHVILRERGFLLWRLLPLVIPIVAVIVSHVFFWMNHYAFASAATIVVILTVLGGLVAHRTMVSHGAMQDFGATPSRFLIASNFLTLAFLLGGGLSCVWAVVDFVYDDVLENHHSIYVGIERKYKELWVTASGDVVASEMALPKNYGQANGYRRELRSMRSVSNPDADEYAELVGLDVTGRELEEQVPALVAAHSTLRIRTEVGNRYQTKFFQQLGQLGQMHSPATVDVPDSQKPVTVNVLPPRHGSFHEPRESSLGTNQPEFSDPKTTQQVSGCLRNCKWSSARTDSSLTLTGRLNASTNALPQRPTCSTGRTRSAPGSITLRSCILCTCSRMAYSNSIWTRNQ